MLAVPFPSTPHYLLSVQLRGSGLPTFQPQQRARWHPCLSRCTVLLSCALQEQQDAPEPVEQFLFERKPQQLPCQKQNSCFWQIIFFFNVQMDNTK